MDLFDQDSIVLNNYPFHRSGISLIENDYFTKNQYPIVYIIYDLVTNIAYVGESTNALNRMNNHLGHPEKRKLKNLFIVSSSKFNKSATLDIESNLIKYMSADGKFQLLNGNAGLADHNYYQKDYYFELFQDLWKNLQLKKVVKKNILEIDNSDLFKYSPYKSLSDDQHKAVQEYLHILAHNDVSRVFVEGSAGTGKTVLAIFLMKLLYTEVDLDDYDDLEGDSLLELNLVRQIQKKFEGLSVALVIPMASLRKTLQKVFKQIKGLKASMVIGPSDVVKKGYDVLIIDEAHRLLQRKAMVNYNGFDQTNKKLGLGNEGTQLNWILMRSKHQLFFYDDAQSVRPSDIDEEVFRNLKSASKTIKLVSQLRVKAGVDYIKFVDRLLKVQLKPDQGVFESQMYELKIFDSLPVMLEEMKKKEQEYGLARMMAGFSWKWTSPNTGLPDAIIEGQKLFWNRKAHDWINSVTEVNEIGCIHTTQGYDLNYGGLIFGKEIGFDKENQEIIVRKENYFDKKGKEGITDLEVLREYIINIYKTLMFRGIRGTYIYVVDHELKAYLKQYIKSGN